MPKPKNSPSAPDISFLRNEVGVLPSAYTQSDGPQPPNAESYSYEQPLLESYARFRSAPLDWAREVSIWVSGEGWRSYDNVIGQPCFYPGYSDDMKSAVVKSTLLKGKVAELSERRMGVEEGMGLFKSNGKGGEGIVDVSRREKRRKEIEQSLWDVVDKMLDEVICKMDSKRTIRAAYYGVSNLLTRAYHQGIHVSSEEVVRLRATADHAEKTKQSIIFLPCHKSHIDYLSLQVICYRLGLTLPIVVAGDNLNFPLVGTFLQHTGAMYIRRSFGEDKLYSTLVQAYIDTLLQKGYNFECFIEGTRSRTGKLLPPKFGILNMLLESVLSGRVKDAIVCPVSTQYDKVIEVDSYVSELLGQPKKKENLQDFLSASSVLSLKLGRVDVRFHEPWSMRGFIEEQQGRFNRMPQQVSSSESSQQTDHVRLLRTMGFRVLSEINAVSVIMPTALIGTILLTLRGRGVAKSELIRRMEWLSERVRRQGGRVAHFAGSTTKEVVNRGLAVLGPELVGVVQGLAEETFYAVDRFQLSFYRNMTIHLFISEALVSAGLYTRVKLGTSRDHQRMSFKELIGHVQFLSQLFRGEFIFPTEGLTANLDKTLRGLEAEGTLTVARSPVDSNNVTYVELSETEREKGRENYDFYCFMIWPFIETAWLGAVSLMMMTPPQGANKDTWLNMQTVQNQAQLLGKTLYHQGDLSYFESVNKETLKNTYQRFEEEGIILVAKSKDNRIPTTMKLAPEWTPEQDPSDQLLPRGRLWEFADSISQSRREGKNRRDGSTVVTRVLSLVEQVGRNLFDNAATATSASTHAVEDSTKPKNRKLMTRVEPSPKL